MAAAQKQLKRWAFTLPSTKEDGTKITADEVKKAILTLGHKYAFQEEKGAGGLLHFQGRFSGKTPYRKSELINKKLFGGKIHWSIEHSEESSGFYVTKEDSRVDGPWTDKDQPPYVPLKFRNFVMRPQQQWIANRLESQNDRKMLFIVDKRGNTGKSTFGLYLRVSRGAIRVPSSLKSAEDISQMVMEHVRANPGKVYTIVLDIPRSVRTDEHWAKWLAALEDIKNGHVYDKRYHWREAIFEPPRVLVFANAAPPRHLLTGDRFDVVDMLWILFSTGQMDEAAYQAAKAEERLQAEKWKKRVHNDIESDPDDDEESGDDEPEIDE